MAELVGRRRDVAGTADEQKIIHWEGKHSELKERSKLLRREVYDNWVKPLETWRPVFSWS